ncbi:MAG TPA: acetyl-CoA carboxylase biotin carboxylase subunit [Thermoplasmata archaeon]|nr:acetyl-CoA carboxylase biotin carboxylase subunit [Thermoplasmata archaeon]
MFLRVLIANRGEIAIRVARTCREMGIHTVGVYSTADRDSLHRRHVDESHEIGPAPAIESYLNIDQVLAAAKSAGADAIHPGYGFLSENPVFSRRCAEEGFVFVGPGPEAMAKSGDKIAAKRAMAAAGLVVTPGSEGVRSEEDARVAAKDLGLPVILKASGGGGGIGMAIVHRQDEVPAAFRVASSAALAAFGNPEVFVEKFHRHPRHIEAQVVVDRHGNAVFLGERECSIQRRHQKLVEESPSPAVGPKTRKKIGEMAVTALRAIGYENAGTVEFLYAGGKFYFNEINARLQVEHTVTEMVTGLDLVAEQLRVAAGESLGVSQDEVRLNGWAIECRVNAEDPTANFAPSPGLITRYRAPGGPGVRVDSGVAEGSSVLAFYDPLIAKLVAHGRTRDAAIARMARAVREFTIEGVATVLPLHRHILEDEAFRKGELATTFLEDRGILVALAAQREDEVAAIAAALAARPSLAAHLRPRLQLLTPTPSKWASAGRPHGGEHAAAHRGRWPRT